jgi:hypothetical protein
MAFVAQTKSATPAVHQKRFTKLSTAVLWGAAQHFGFRFLGRRPDVQLVAVVAFESINFINRPKIE